MNAPAMSLDAWSGVIDACARLVVAETGKTTTQARREVLRCINTLKL